MCLNRSGHPPKNCTRNGGHKARQRRVVGLEMLERRYAMSADIPGIDILLGSVSGGETTCTCSMCMQTMESSLIERQPVVDEPQGADPVAPADTLTTVTPVDLSQTFKLHSNPNAKHKIYLDFNGHTATGTTWNTSRGMASIQSPAYDIDGNRNAFSDAELRNIQWMWERVSEDYSPFEVDVTTEEPPADQLIKSSTTDTQWGVRVVIGGSSNDWLGQTAGGIAYIGSFNWNTDTPAYVFPAQLGNGHEKYTAEAISHEVGHTLGLGHDGRKNPVETYYSGHGTGETSWAPIMGSAYYKNVTQWSKGEYAGADNVQDDLSIITSFNGFGYRADEHGNDQADASLLVYNGNNIKDWGIISTVNDTDVFTFNSGAGTIQIKANPLDRGPNLDIRLELLNSAFQVLASSNPTNLLGASLSWTVTAAAQYYVRVTGVGTGDPATSGYSNYASLGQYFLSGNIISNSGEFLSVSRADASKAEGDEGSTPYTFRIGRTGDVSQATTVNYSITGNGTSPANAADFVGGVLPSGTVTFAAGETAKFITVNVLGDKVLEANETFAVNITTTKAGALLTTSSAIGSILNDESSAAVVVKTNVLMVSELGTKTQFTVVLSEAPKSIVGVPISSTDTTEGIVSKTMLVFTATNWNIPQVVVVTGIDDNLADGNMRFSVQIGATISSDAKFKGLAGRSLSAVTVDNEVAAAGTRRGAAIGDESTPIIESVTNHLEKEKPISVTTEDYDLDKPVRSGLLNTQVASAAPQVAPTLETRSWLTDTPEKRVVEKLDAIDSYFADLGL